MLHYEGYVGGWLDTSIRDFLESFPWRSRNAAFALVTCLDSNANPASLLVSNKALHGAPNGAKRLDNGLLLPSKLLQEPGFRNDLFFGFDEVWFFPDDRIEPKPNAASIVGPGRINQSKLENLGRWISTNRCSLALGDGDGLNVIVKAQGLARYLIGQPLFQPEPTFHVTEFVKVDEEQRGRTVAAVKNVFGAPQGQPAH